MHPRLPVLIGIDGGSTYSFGVAIDRSGNVRAAAQAGTLNFFGAGLKEARRNLNELIKALELQLPLGNLILRTVIGTQALFMESTEEQREKLFKGILPLDSTRLVSHSMIAYHGACLGAPAVLIFCGTGSIVLAQNESGEYFQAGGWGHLLGDEGSAYWIAIESLRAAIAATEGRGPETGLVEALCRWFQVKDLTEIPPIIYETPTTKERLAMMSETLSEWLGDEDQVYRDICWKGGKLLAEQAVSAIHLVNLQLKPMPVFLMGGVASRNVLVRTSIVTALQKEFTIRIEEPKLPALLGAAILAHTDAGLPIEEDLVQKLSASYQARLDRDSMRGGGEETIDTHETV